MASNGNHSNPNEQGMLKKLMFWRSDTNKTTAQQAPMSNGHINGNNGYTNGTRASALPSVPASFPNRSQKRYAHISGWGMSVPERILTNKDLEAIVETSDDWIRTRTGIHERRIAGEGESTTHLAVRAAQKALAVADLLPTDIDLIIVATSTPEHVFPSTASLVQDRLGASRAGAFDLSAACSGFVYGMDLASSKIRCGDMDHILVIGAETMSRVLNWSDRGTCILFGDGAGAVVVSASKKPGGILSSTLRSDGSGWEMLGVPTIGSRDTFLQEKMEEMAEADDDTRYAMHRLHMNGREVFRFATRVINDSIKDVLRQANIELSNLSLIIPHQANQRILEAAARGLKVPVETFYSNVARYGNTSAASIPIALCEAIEEGRVRVGDNLVFIGFGGGLTWAAMSMNWQTEIVSTPQRIMGARRQLTYWYADQRRGAMKFWRSTYNKVAGSPTPNATMRQLRKRLDEQDWEDEKEGESPKS